MWDGIGRNSHNPIYMCMVRMILKSWYIMWEGDQRKGIEKPREKKIRKYKTKERTLISWLYISLDYVLLITNEYYILFAEHTRTKYIRLIVGKIPMKNRLRS